MHASEVTAIAYIVFFVILALCGVAWLVWHAILSLFSHPSFPSLLAAPFVVGIEFRQWLPGFFRGRVGLPPEAPSPTPPPETTPIP